MRHTILILTIGLLTMQPASASVADCDTALKAAGYPIDGVSGSGPTDPSLRVDCSQCTTQQAASALALAQQASTWNSVQPKPTQFVADCNGDGTLSVTQRQNINIMALWYLRGSTALALNVWTAIKASATSPQITAIQTHATANNITLP